MISRVAAIDFGTNTARLLIADCRQDGTFEHVRIEREIVRMGGGFSREKGLSPEAVQRGLACLRRFAVIIRDHEVTTIHAVATSAVRDAVNGLEFIARVREETGIVLSLIDGILEGNLTLAGVMTGLDEQHNDLLLFDIGGGSTEYTIAREGKSVFVRSLPLGVVRLTEGKVTLSAMRTKINKELDALLQQIESAGLRVPAGTVLVGTAGTATTLAAIHMGMVNYDYRRVNNLIIARQDIQAIYERLAPLAPADRLTIPGLEKGREDLIIAGILITLQTMELFGMDAMKVSDYGLLEGLIVNC